MSISFLSLLGQEIFVLETLLHVEDISDTTGVVVQLLPGPIELVSLDLVALWDDVVLAAKLKYLLCVFDTTNVRAGDGPSEPEKRKLRESVGLWNETQLTDSAIHLKEWQEVSNLMSSWDRV